MTDIVSKTLYRDSDLLVTFTNDLSVGGVGRSLDPLKLPQWPLQAAASGVTPQDALRTLGRNVKRTLPEDLRDTLQSLQAPAGEEDWDTYRYSVRCYWNRVRAVFLDDSKVPSQHGWDGALWVRRLKDFKAAVAAHSPEWVVCDMDLSGAWQFQSYHEEFPEEVFDWNDIGNGLKALQWLYEHAEEQLSNVPGYRVPKVLANSANPDWNKDLQPLIDRLDTLREKVDQ